jgi:hypothetical protein
MELFTAITPTAELRQFENIAPQENKHISLWNRPLGNAEY